MIVIRSSFNRDRVIIFVKRAIFFVGTLKKSRSDIFFPISALNYPSILWRPRSPLRFPHPIYVLKCFTGSGCRLDLAVYCNSHLGTDLGRSFCKESGDLDGKGDGEACPLTLQYHGGCYVSCSCFLSAPRNHTCTSTWLCWMSMFCARFAVFVRRARVLPRPCPATRNLS